MATWIAHLRIAELLLPDLPGLDEAMFAVGNIAPDSGIPDEKWEKFTPPSEVTHFQAPERAQHACADLDFYRAYLTSCRLDVEGLRYAFLLGYFCHLVADNLWSLWIGKPTYRRFIEQFEADHNFIWEVKKDWYGLDFEYVRSHPDSLYWRVFLGCEYPVNYLNVVLTEGVRQRIVYIQDYYQRTDAHVEELVSRERVYLTQPEMDTFVHKTANLLNEAIQGLTQERYELENLHSILEVFGPSLFIENGR